ncbi:MAG: hypothetical protein ACRD9S_23395, partial [Pyrinomonadaceae bacterium]
VQDELTDMFTSYRVKLLGAGRVEVETDSFGSLGLNIIARYEASEREVKPLYTNTGTPMAALFFGLMGALIPGSHRDNRGQTARQLILIENDRLASVTTRVYVVGGGPLGHLRPANRRPHFYVEVNDVIFVFSPR